MECNKVIVINNEAIKAVVTMNAIVVIAITIIIRIGVIIIIFIVIITIREIIIIIVIKTEIKMIKNKIKAMEKNIITIEFLN